MMCGGCGEGACTDSHSLFGFPRPPLILSASMAYFDRGVHASVPLQYLEASFWGWRYPNKVGLGESVEGSRFLATLLPLARLRAGRNEKRWNVDRGSAARGRDAPSTSSGQALETAGRMPALQGSWVDFWRENEWHCRRANNFCC